MRSLPLFHRIAGARVVVVGDGPMADAKRRLVERAGGKACSETEAHNARLAFVAITDPRLAKAAALRLRGKGLLVNVADRPELCDFTLPSILERDPVLIAISTSGASAGLAKHLRARLEAFLPDAIGLLAQKLAGARSDLRQKFADPDQRRRVLDDALEEGGPLDILNPASAERVDAWLDNPSVANANQHVEFTLSSDDPDDLTLRQLRLLARADIIVHDAGIPDAILNRARADAIRHIGSLPDDKPTGLILVLRRAALNS